MDKERITRFHRPCLTGRDIRRFAVVHSGLYCYFNRDAKRGGCWDESIHSAPDKVLIRQIGEYPEGGIDLKGYAVLNTAFMILPHQDTNIALMSRLVLAVVNSPCIRFVWTNRFRDDRRTFPKIKGEYLKLLPIPDADEREMKLIAAPMNLLTAAISHFDSHPGIQTSRDPLMLSYLERVLNGLVYELYFPGEVHGAGLRPFDLLEKAQIPDINTIPDPERLPRLRQLFETLYNSNHPIRIALDKLQTLDTVRIIEGKA